MKFIRLTNHALIQCEERGTNEEEVRLAIRNGVPEPAKQGRIMYRFNFSYNNLWQDKLYAVKQVAPITVEETNEIVVVTVYAFYF